MVFESEILISPYGVKWMVESEGGVLFNTEARVEALLVERCDHPFGNNNTTTKIPFFPLNTVATRRYHVDKPIYPAHTVTTTKQPEATDDPT